MKFQDRVKQLRLERGWLLSFRSGDKDDEAFRERLLQTFVSDVTISPDDVVIAYNTTEKGPSQCSSTDRKVEIVGSYSNPVILEGRIVLRIQRA